MLYSVGSLAPSNRSVDNVYFDITQHLMSTLKASSLPWYPLGG